VSFKHYVTEERFEDAFFERATAYR
jgi:hypothetical protein